MFFLFEGYGDHRALHVLTHSFPTRRSSDLPLRFASVRIYRDGQLHSSTRTTFDGTASTALPAGRFEVRLFPDGRAGEDRALYDTHNFLLFCYPAPTQVLDVLANASVDVVWARGRGTWRASGRQKVEY